MHLWHNGFLNMEYRQKWETQGISILSDILNDNGDLLPLTEMNAKDLNIHFLEYLKLHNSIKKLQLNKEIYHKFNGPYLPRILLEIGISEKGCNTTYNKLMTYNGNVIQEVKGKWKNVLNEEIQYATVEKAFIDLTKCKESVYKKYLQFKLSHSRTAINEKLVNMHLSKIKMCPLYEIHTETISHAFLECSHVLALWIQVGRWIKSKTNETIKIPKYRQNLRKTHIGLVEKIILSAKVVIFNTIKNGKQHHINDVTISLFRQLRTEEYQATLFLHENEFNKIWEPVYKELYESYS